MALNYLSHHHIPYILHEHQAVHTIEDAELYCRHVPGIPGKNLFLRDQKKKRYFLITVVWSKRVKLDELGEKLWEKKLSFASPEDLMAKLQITPGSVSPFCLIHESSYGVEVFIDQDLVDAKMINLHPNRNTASIELSGTDFRSYLQTLPHTIHILPL